jgi:8-oxo-dGTP diphosphatase
MRFVDPAVVPTLEFGVAYAEIVPRFLASPEYQALVSG